MWEKKLKKTLFTLNVDNYAPEITARTYPLLKYYADKIGADFHVITERKFPGLPPVVEKLQIFELAKAQGNDWNIYIDSDAIVHPETIDFTLFLPKDVMMHNGTDFAPVRWKYDRFFMRDGRNVGSCNWLTFASDLLIELWEPFADITFEEAVANIRPTVDELGTIITAEHLVDDYLLSRNIAKYGLKSTTVEEVMKRINLGGVFFWHQYTIGIEEKIQQIDETLVRWNLDKAGFYSGPLLERLTKIRPAVEAKMKQEREAAEAKRRRQQ